MKIRLPIFLALAAALLATTPKTITAAPLVSIGDNADIFFNGSSSLRWSSNVFRDEDDEVDDFWWTLTPGFEVNLGRGISNLDLSVVTRYEIRRYADLDELDTELFSIEANGSYRSSRLDLSGSVYFREVKTTSGDVNNPGLPDDLIESDVFGGQLNAEYRFSPKFSFGAGFRYMETEYKDPFDDYFADRESFSVPLDLFYELTPKVDLSVGYTYGEDESKGVQGVVVRPAFTTENHFFNVGARGNLLPKLSGFFKVGYRTSDNDLQGSDSRSTLGLDGSLSWAATPKLTNSLSFSRDFGIGGEGDATTNTSVSVSSNYSINSFYAATVFADYTLREFDDAFNREDNQYRLGGRLSFTPNQYWRFGAGYTYSENDSNAFDRSYEDHSIDITASLRY